MRILIVMSDYFNQSNGMSISTRRFVKEFIKMGHEVSICTNNRYETPEYPLLVEKIPLFSSIIEKEGFTFAKLDSKMIDQAIQWADYIHIEDPFKVCHYTVKRARQLHKPVGGTFHIYPENMTYAVGWSSFGFINQYFMNCFLKSYRRLDYVQCPTKKVYDRLIFNRLTNRMEIISNGIDEFYLNGQRSSSQKGKFKVITVGRYAHEKNQKILIQAMAQSKHLDDMELYIIGKGPIEKQLKTLAESYHIQAHFNFLKKEDLRALLLQCDVYVHCAKVEIEGMSCMEAFACGCVPIIMNANLSSTSIYSLHEENRFEEDKVEELSRKIDFFYENREILNKYSQEYMDYSKSLSVENCARKAMEVITEVVDQYE